MLHIYAYASHPHWGEGRVISHPVWSVLVGGEVVNFLPDKKEFAILVPMDELTKH